MARHASGPVPFDTVQKTHPKARELQGGKGWHGDVWPISGAETNGKT